MSFFRDLSIVSARRPLVATVLASALLAACGGGEQEETFQPTRIVAVGDENTLINPDGSQYSVNNVSVSATTNPNGVPCINNPIWVQYVAADYGLSFGECRGAATDATRKYAVMLAQVGQTVDQAAAALAGVSPALNQNDLVTLMVGSHDLLAIVGTNKTPNAADREAMITAAEKRGEALGDVVLNTIATGARILITTVPYLNTAPVVVAEGYDANLLYEMSTAFNDGLNARMSLVPGGGGRSGAIVEVDQLVNSYYLNSGAAYNAITNRVAAACQTAGAPTPDADLDTCKTTDVTTASPIYYLWAGRMQYGTITHGLLGQTALQRIRANPL
ncbi:hypothetical protein [Piscinibacter gummiphilus]|uniref:Uncharacterized protein n=1 Tax=Piscinibacter gummiphilus TaxID=946333 RepID=A0A1W6L427_9BURK|nr:hypothetical protein [Piscinibacter gummiphilus]ARN18947.1 hypothetical protein A4W93_02890 [Piscinibacter gummiphilus]ATU63592.1 hypothetical protein CPZ87_02965 [Piscinibacter gummiphilus]GLS92730.1 acylhydrolase [Piscinibacter gummiphilus]